MKVFCFGEGGWERRRGAENSMYVQTSRQIKNSGIDILRKSLALNAVSVYNSISALFATFSNANLVGKF